MRIFTFLFFVAFSFNLFAQNNADTQPYIEVTGTAEKVIVPDEIYISIFLMERYDGKKKYTVEKQEDELKSALDKEGINLENLRLSDSQSNYVKVKWSKKDVLNQKELELKVKDAKTVAEVFQILDELDIENASIARVDHSKMDEFRKEVKIEAIRAAKEKAFYLLEAIDEKPGPLLTVFENNYSPVVRNTMNVRNDGLFVENEGSYSQGKELPSIGFKKITLRSSIYLKYAIE